MLEVDGFDIALTRGDTAFFDVILTNDDGTEYVPVEGDTVRFALKKSYKDDECLIRKSFPTTTMVLELEPEDTKPLSFTTYVYDIEFTDHLGHVSTPIKGKFKVTEEVD